MRLQLFRAMTTYAGVQQVAIFLSEGESNDLAVYLPNRVKRAPTGLKTSSKQEYIPTWSQDGVMDTRIKEVLRKKSMGNRNYHQASNHTPAKYLQMLLNHLIADALNIAVNQNTVTVIVKSSVNYNEDVLANVKQTVIELFKAFNVDELTRTLRGFDDIQEVNVLTTDGDIDMVEVPDNDAVELEKVCETFNHILHKDADFSNRKVAMEDGCICLTIPKFGSIWTTVSEDDVDVQEVHIETDSVELKERLEKLNNIKLTQAIDGVLRHASKDCDALWQAFVRPTCTIECPHGDKLPKSKEGSRSYRDRSIREMTHRPDIHFKLPVTPVMYNYTNFQIAVDGTRVVSYTDNVQLQSMEHEGEPVIGIILDFNHPVSGLHDMYEVRSKNPNLPIYIMWNSESGPMMELYNES